MPTMTRCALAPVLARFIEKHPNVVVRVVEGYSATLTEQVQAGELEFAIVPAFSGAPGLKSRLFLRTPELLVAGCRVAAHALAPVRLAELGPLKLVVPSKANTRRRLIETYLASNGVQVERLLELDAMLGTLDFVARTDWVTILPGLMMAERDTSRQFTVNPIVAPPFGLDLVLIEPSRRPMSPAAQAFLAMLEEESTRQQPAVGASRSLMPASTGNGCLMLESIDRKVIRLHWQVIAAAIRSKLRILQAISIPAHTRPSWHGGCC